MAGPPRKEIFLRLPNSLFKISTKLDQATIWWLGTLHTVMLHKIDNDFREISRITLRAFVEDFS